MCFDPVLYYAQNKSLTEKERYDIVELVIKNKPIPVKQRGIRSNQGSGKKVADIAKMYGTREEWISQVCRKYREQGLEEFIRNKYKTNHRALTDAEEDAILAPYEKAAEAG